MVDPVWSVNAMCVILVVAVTAYIAYMIRTY